MSRTDFVESFQEKLAIYRSKESDFVWITNSLLSIGFQERGATIDKEPNWNAMQTLNSSTVEVAKSDLNHIQGRQLKRENILTFHVVKHCVGQLCANGNSF